MLQPSLSFEIFPTYDSRVLIVADTSVWKHLIEESTYIDITLPGSKNKVTHPYQKGKVNLFNSANLGYGCVNCEDDLVALPDGIYTIKIYVCDGDKFFTERNYLRTVNLELKVNKLLTGLNLECNPNPSCLNQIIHIDILLRGAKADILFGNINSARAKYELACEEYENLNHCDCKPDCKNGHFTTTH